MPIFKLIEESEADERVKKVYEDVKESYGGILPPLYKCLANDPEYLESINEHRKRVLAPRKVDAKTKEVVAYTVAVMNQCDYCTHAHAGNLRRKFEYDDEALAELLGVIAYWNEITRFNIGARLTWPFAD